MKFEKDKRGGSQQDIPFKKGKQKCLVCGRVEDYHCRVREDEKVGLCSFVSNDTGKRDKADKRWIHHVDVGDSGTAESISQNDGEANKSSKKDAEDLSTIYHCFLLGLQLNEEHRDDLLGRGFSDETIKNNRYKSVPTSDHSKKIAILNTTMGLEGVPGFYVDTNDRWCLHLKFPGFYVPYLDKDGEIVGLQIRRDDGKPKYMWLSSSAKKRGTSSGTPLHFARPDFFGENRTVYITEGALKADIIADQLHVPVVASAGVDVIKATDLEKAIYEAFPDVERIVVAYDMDWSENTQVRAALDKLVQQLKDEVVDVSVLAWDISVGKGLDDVLISDRRDDAEMTEISAEEFLNPTSFEEEIGALSDEIEANEKSQRVAYSWNDFRNLELVEDDKVVFGLARGNVGLLNASTNLGKSTLSMNLALSAASKRTLAPLLEEGHSARRVLYIDGESTKSELQSDVAVMLRGFSEDEIDLVEQNLFLVCDEEVDGQMLDLANADHRLAIENFARDSKPDLIIVDTLSALMAIEDENDNAKVKKEVMQPLRDLARRTNSAVLLLHHTGKYVEGSAATGAYKGRGASALGALSRAVFGLERDATAENRVTLVCHKVKGDRFGNTTLELNRQSRWFEFAGVAHEEQTQYAKVVEFVCGLRRVVSRAEISKGLNIPDSTVGRILKRAVECEDLKKAGHGKFICPNAQEDAQELAVDE